MKTIIPILLLCLLIAQSTQAQFSLSGEIRPRSEYSHGFATLAAENQDASLFTTQRTRLNFDYKNERVKAGLVLQDVRTWGSQPQLVNNEDYATSVHQAWAEVFFAPMFSLKAGRQELSYDDHRILGNVGWAQQARSHDVAVFKYENTVNLHVGIAHHENTNRTNNLYDGPDAYKNLQFIWLNQKSDKLLWSLLFLNNGKPVMKSGKQETQYSQTMGGHLEIPIKKTKLSGNLYMQTGQDGANKDLSAFNLMIDYAFVSPLGCDLNLGYEYLSGTPYDEKTKNKSFLPLYGTNHKFNGFMDYFYVGNHANNVGLQDIYLKWARKMKKIKLNADVHVFSAAADLSADAKKYLGTEIDLTGTYTLDPTASISVGYSHMLAGKSMQLLKGGSKSETHNWAYIMLTITPKFIQ